MKPIVFLCDATEREDLVAAFNDCRITAVRRTVQSGPMSLVGLEVTDKSPRNIFTCALAFARKRGRVLQARRDDPGGKAHPVDVIEKDILQVLSANQGNLHLFLFREKEEKDEATEKTKGV